MSKFLKALEQERHELEPIANPQGLDAALRHQAAAKAARAAFREQNSRSMQASTQEQELFDIESAANQAVSDFRQRAERAGARIRDIDRLLTAGDDRMAALKAIAAVNVKTKDDRTRLARLRAMVAELRGEIEVLKQRRADELAARGAAEVEARIVGKALAPMKVTAEIDRDIELRTQALESAEAATVTTEARIATHDEELRKEQAKYRNAICRVTEVAFYESVGSIAPILATLTVLNSALTQSSRHGEFVIALDGESMAAAEAAIVQSMAVA